MRRLQCDTALWHVFARGARRLELFRDDEDFTHFLGILSFGIRDSGCALLSYALMGNHYHFILQADSRQLARCMHQVNRMYSRYHNPRYGMSGHVFDGPYKAYRQPTALLSLWKLAYVFLNPVKAGLCQAPEDYLWSGYRSFVGLDGSPLRIDPTPFMNLIDPNPERAWKRFYDCMEAEARRPSRRLVGKPTMLDVHADQFEWLVDQASLRIQGLPIDDPETLAIYWARLCGIAPRAMARALGQRDSYEIRQTLRKFRIRLSEDPELARLSALP